MTWYFYIVYFFAGAFLANSVPHLVNGVSGQKFPSPFAHPPGKGSSTPTVNVLWGFANFVIGYLLISCFGSFNPGLSFDSLAVLIGALILAIQLSIAFGKRKKR